MKTQIYKIRLWLYVSLTECSWSLSAGLSTGIALSRHFPDTALPITYAEQAGLIRRIVERYGLRTLYAAVPRAYHAGFVGTNRPGSELTGSFAEQVRELSGMSGEEMNRRAGIFEDITPCDMTPREIDRIRIISLQSDCIAEAL